MTIKDFSLDEVSESVREMTEEATRAAMKAVEMAIADISKAAETAQEAAELAVKRSEEICISVRTVAEEATKTAREAASLAIEEANKSVQAARLMTLQTTNQAEKINESTRQWAEEATKSTQEATEKAMNDANKALEIAETVAKQIVARTEEFSRSAQKMAAEAAQAAKEASEAAIREANSAASTTREALREASKKAEGISNLARELAEQASRSAKEAADSARRAFEESMAKSLSRAEKMRQIQAGNARQEEIEKADAVQTTSSHQPSQGIPSGGNDGEKSEPDAKETITRVSQPARSPWRAILQNSSQKKAEEEKPKPEARETLTGEAEQQEAGGLVTKVVEETNKNGPIADEVDEIVKKIAEFDAKERARREVELNELRKGNVEIVTSCTELGQQKYFELQLRRIENLRVMWSSGSDGQGASIVVSLLKPLPLIRILSEMPAVKSVTSDGNKIRVLL